jgi:hypothetical protein
VDIAQFTATVSWAKTQGNIWIDTVGTISAYWIGAYKFSALTATTSGTDKTWTWKTSDFATPFPPGQVPARDDRRRHPQAGQHDPAMGRPRLLRGLPGCRDADAVGAIACH